MRGELKNMNQHYFDFLRCKCGHCAQMRRKPFHAVLDFLRMERLLNWRKRLVLERRKEKVFILGQNKTGRVGGGRLGVKLEPKSKKHPKSKTKEEKPATEKPPAAAKVEAKVEATPKESRASDSGQSHMQRNMELLGLRFMEIVEEACKQLASRLREREDSRHQQSAF